jgi:ribosomal protein S18 acetylase RimI-like enzyme
LPRWRGGGIGSRLVTEVIARAEELGWRAIDLEVDSGHQRAISLYTRHQFRPHFQESALSDFAQRALSSIVVFDL